MNHPPTHQPRPASNVAHATGVTLSEWSGILKVWGPRGSRDSKTQWLRREYGLADQEIDAILRHVAGGSAANADPLLKTRG